MDAKRLLPKTHKQYSKGKITEEQLPDVALEEANGRFGRTHKIALFFLNLFNCGARAFGYSATAIVGASAVVPAFLSVDAMLSNAPLYLKYLYAFPLGMGSVGLGLASYYTGSITHKITKATSARIKLLKLMEKTDPETAVEIFMREINAQDAKQ